MSAEEDLRKAIAEACMRPGRHEALPFSPENPTDWCPGKVQNPEAGMGFGDTAAFEFIAQVAKSQTPMTKTQYTMKVNNKEKILPAYEFTPVMPDGKTVYIKVIFQHQMVLGVSFHYSVKTPDRRPN